MGENRKNANERRLEQLRALRDEVLDSPSMEELIEQQAARIAELETEVDRLRSLLDALKPRPERTFHRSKPSTQPTSENL